MRRTVRPIPASPDASLGLMSTTAAPLSFATLAERARARGEVAIGVQRGDDLELNPRARRQKSLRLGPEDKLVVLGQCF